MNSENFVESDNQHTEVHVPASDLNNEIDFDENKDNNNGHRDDHQDHEFTVMNTNNTNNNNNTNNTNNTNPDTTNVNEHGHNEFQHDDISELSEFDADDNASMNTQQIREDAAETVAPMIRRYAELHQKISEISALARGYRAELKELEGKITNYMRQNEIGNFNLGNEKSLELRQSFRRAPLSKKHISAAVANFPENVSTELFAALFVDRPAEAKFSLKMK